MPIECGVLMTVALREGFPVGVLSLLVTSGNFVGVLPIIEGFGADDLVIFFELDVESESTDGEPGR